MGSGRIVTVRVTGSIFSTVPGVPFTYRKSLLSLVTVMTRAPTLRTSFSSMGTALTPMAFASPRTTASNSNAS